MARDNRIENASSSPQEPAPVEPAPVKRAPVKRAVVEQGRERSPSKAGSQSGRVGGAIPGKPGAFAYSHVVPRSMPLPVLIAVPHAGRAYPSAILARMRNARLSQLRLEDRYVDRIARAIAHDTGTALLVAHAPRAMLDLNRAEDDIDWDMVRGDARTLSQPRLRRTGTDSRARSGLGLVPRRLPGFGEIWRGKIGRDELEGRIDAIHTPYHDFLALELERIRDAWGAALLIDLHSMPPLRRSGDGASPPRVVIGDRFGATCHTSLIAKAFAHLEGQGCVAAHNRPYSGGYVLDRHASVKRGIHAMQIELCRSTYLDEHMAETTPAVEPLARMLAGLVRELGAQTARLGMADQMPQAAE